ncbi:MAG: dehydrogenase [Alphaproteobacteria bacterium]|nr:dehydrogenase [Alphaproteobacteria bacterium]
MSKFRVGYSAYLKRPDGRPGFPAYDLSPLGGDPRIDLVELPQGQPLAAGMLGQFDAVVLLGEQVSAPSLQGVGRLRLIARMGVGYDTLDVPACTSADVAIAITPPGVRRPMATTVLAFLLALSHRLMAKDRISRKGAPGWNERLDQHGTGLVGRTLGIVGLGNIGAEVARLAKPFELRLIAHDPYVSPDLPRALGVEMLALDDVFRQADFLSLNCPLNEETRYLANARRLALMKPTAFLINTARGPVVEQAALVATLKTGRIAGAGLDVFDPEPPPADDPILKLDNALFGPHALGWSDQMFATMAEVNRAQIAAVMAGQTPEHVVNREVLTRPGFLAKLKRNEGWG